ncbi:nuclear transport factor 2 family protein [Fodinicola feengrottensis]|uniref:Nuclear transport factor 2 family protein n=1 Tax=Fodinicola feengrottensis TaxID=435914 RepID=A0ABN2HV43_9ACTN|nr:nuclear transport factor 2 family protein [Fodinicola feengrottensis]
MPQSCREVLAAYHQAMIDMNADDLADLYAVDCLHHFPFAAPGRPPVYYGREEVRAGYRAAWHGVPLKLAEVTEVIAYDMADPDTLVGEWVGSGTLLPTGKPFQAHGLLIATVKNGEITDMRDYMDVFGTYRATGRLKDVVAALDET